MTETKDSIIARQKRLFALHDIELEFEDAALYGIAAEAERLGTGARALNRIVLRALDTVDWRLQELMIDNVSVVRVTAATVADAVEPELVYRTATDLVDESETESIDDDLEIGDDHPLMLLRQAAIPESIFFPKSKVKMVPGTIGMITDTTGMDEKLVIEKLLATEKEIGSSKASKMALKWWRNLKYLHRENPAFILRICEELKNRKATVNQFYLAHLYSKTDNIRAIFHYLDYTKAKVKWEVREQKSKTPPETDPIDGELHPSPKGENQNTSSSDHQSASAEDNDELNESRIEDDDGGDFELT